MMAPGLTHMTAAAAPVTFQVETAWGGEGALPLEVGGKWGPRRLSRRTKGRLALALIQVGCRGGAGGKGKGNGRST